MLKVVKIEVMECRHTDKYILLAMTFCYKKRMYRQASPQYDPCLYFSFSLFLPLPLFTCHVSIQRFINGTVHPPFPYNAGRT